MTILGIDPGLANLGWGVVSERQGRLQMLKYGHITTEAHTPIDTRIHDLALRCDEILSSYDIDEVCIEDIYYFQNKSSAISVAKVIGAVSLISSMRGKDVTMYSPLQIKTTITGIGRAEKKQVQEMVRILLGLPVIPRPDHAADALAVAICHSTQKDSKQRMGLL